MRQILTLLLIGSAAAAADVTAVRLDGSAERGVLRSWDERQAILVTAAGDQAIELDSLLSLRLAATPDVAESQAPRAFVELRDGTQIPIGRLSIEDNDVTTAVALARPNGDMPLTLDKSQVAAAQLQPLDGRLAEQWQEIRDPRPTADIVVMFKKEGTSLDYVEGMLGDVSDDKVEFELDGDTLRIDRKKVAGFIFFRRDGKELAAPRLKVRSKSGLQLNASAARLTNEEVVFTTTGGVELAWPLDDIEFVDFSAGKLLYLSDIKPATESWTPLVGYPASAEQAAAYGKPRRDQAAFGGLLTLADGEEASTANGELRTFDKGLAIRSRTELEYRLPAGYRRLAALAGIDPSGRSTGNVRLQISGDDKSLFDSELAGSQAPQAIDLDIAGVKRLKIVVDFGQNLDTGDWLNLCDLKVVK